MITTTAAGRTWHFDRSLGRPTNEHNGKVGGYRYPVDLAIAPDGNIFVLSHGNQFGGGQIGYRDNGRVGKTTFDEHHLGDFARREFTWPAGIAVDSEGWVYVSDEHENVIKKFDPEATHPFPTYDPDGEAIATFGVPGGEPGQLDGPTGIQFDADDNLYVVESRNNRVQKFTKDGEFLLGFGRPGTGGGRVQQTLGYHHRPERGHLRSRLGQRPYTKILAGGRVPHELRRGVRRRAYPSGQRCG